VFARAVRFRLFVLITLTAAAALVVVACSSEPEEPVQQEQAAEPAEEEPARPVPAVEAVEQQEAQPDEPARPPANPVSLLVAESAALERNGYWEQALAVRDTAIAAGGSLDPQALTSLTLDRVRLLLRLDRPSDAQTALTEISGFQTPNQSRRHDLLRARAALALAQTDVAVEAMTDYVNTDSPAWALI